MSDVSIETYSAALDEIYRLRQALAYEALVCAVHGDYKTFPKSRRDVLANQVERMQKAARGLSGHAYGGLMGQSLRLALRDAGASETLTRTQFEAEIPKRKETK